MVKTAGLFHTLTSQYKRMIEVAIPAIVAAVTGGAVLFTRVHNRIHDLDRRVDTIELRMVESFVGKEDFARSMDQIQSHMIRIEEKLDKLVDKNLR